MTTLSTETMQVAFYAPMKAPDHPVPSGDRQMARALMKAFSLASFEAEIASRFRSYSSRPAEQALAEAARPELERVLAGWQERREAPKLWITYHPYYKAPDFLGPEVSGRLGIPYVTIEASYAAKRDRDEWSRMQAIVVRALKSAALNICFTPDDRQGLASIVEEERLAELPPFIETESFPQARRRDDEGPVRLIAVAMMRGGVKLESFRMLARALSLVADKPWTLTIVGDGPERASVVSALAGLPAERISWMGEVRPDDVPRHLADADVFVWPGTGEAYGIAYLEAQAAGLPVIAQSTHGVPAVVRHGETGLLTPPGNDWAFAEAISRLITNAALRHRLGGGAHQFVHSERSLAAAADVLQQLLSPLVTSPSRRRR